VVCQAGESTHKSFSLVFDSELHRVIKMNGGQPSDWLAGTWDLGEDLSRFLDNELGRQSLQAQRQAPPYQHGAALDLSSTVGLSAPLVAQQPQQFNASQLLNVFQQQRSAMPQLSFLQRQGFTGSGATRSQSSGGSMKTCSMKSGKAGTTDEECEDKTPWTQEELKALANAHVTCCLKLLEAKKSTSLADMTGKKAILDSIMKETKELLPSFSMYDVW